MRSAEPLKTASTAPIDCSMSPALKIASRPKSKSCTPAKRPPAAVSAPVNALLNLPLAERPAASASASTPLNAPRRFFVASALKSDMADLKPVFSRPNFPAARSVSLPSDAVADSAWCRSPFALLRACAYAVVWATAFLEMSVYRARAPATPCSAPVSDALALCSWERADARRDSAASTASEFPLFRADTKASSARWTLRVCASTRLCAARSFACACSMLAAAAARLLAACAADCAIAFSALSTFARIESMSMGFASLKAFAMDEPISRPARAPWSPAPLNASAICRVRVRVSAAKVTYPVASSTAAMCPPI